MRFEHRLSRRLLVLASALALLVLLSSACGDQSFTVRYAPDFPRGGTSVSVFGVFKDGRLSSEAWDALNARFSVPLHATTCDVQYGARLLAEEPELAAAVDDYTRDYGPTDDLLDKFAPLAKSDAILLFTIAGHPPRASGDGGLPSSAPPPVMRGGRRGGRGGMGPSASSGPTSDRNVFELSAMLFSVKLHRTVAFIGMSYRGPTVEDALTRFAERLAQEMPGSSCMAWNQEMTVDPKVIHDMGEP